jgi:hypothetical protein
MIVKIDSFETASFLVKCVQNNESLKDVQGFVDAYQNGREQGLCLNIYSKGSRFICYYVCEGRGTDSITIYKGSGSNQGISEDAAQNGREFGRDMTAARVWLVDDILKFVET